MTPPVVSVDRGSRPGEPVPDDVPQLRVHISGVVIPSWLAVCLLLTAIFAGTSLLVSWQKDIEQKRELKVELRLLQQRLSDVESVLVRSGIATRRDFIPQATEKGK